MNAGKNIGRISVRVFLDTKSDQVRVELAQGDVAKTLEGGKGKGEPSIEIDLDSLGEVLAIRVGPLEDILDDLHLKPKA
jgi:hypothetical protein